MTDHKRKKPAKQWARNTEGIRTRAEEKARNTRLRAMAALARLTGADASQDVVINFQTVARAANCSPSWLYGHTRNCRMRSCACGESRSMSGRVR